MTPGDGGGIDLHTPRPEHIGYISIYSPTQTTGKCANMTGGNDVTGEDLPCHGTNSCAPWRLSHDSVAGVVKARKAGAG
jgi:hypothetical protein